MTDWANHSPHTGEDSDRRFRDFMMIMAAFQFGFGSHVIHGRDDYWDPNSIRSHLNYFATELKSPGFAVLISALAELEDEASTLLQSSKALDLLDSLGVSWSWDSPPANRKLRPLVDKLARWNDDTRRFGDSARHAVLETSPYRIWFNCGRWLGECMTLSKRDRTGVQGSFLRGSVRHLQESVGKLPPPFLEAFDWLETFRDFDFQVGNPADWVTIAPSYDNCGAYEPGNAPDGIRDNKFLPPLWTDRVPNVIDFESLLEYFYQRFTVALGWNHFLMANDIELGAGAVTTDALVGDKQPGKTEDAGGNAGEAGQDAKPPTLKWDEAKQQLLINGTPLAQYAGTAISDSGWEKHTFERNAWIYLKCLEGVAYATICSKMKTLCSQLNKKDRKWRVISDPQGIQTRAREFAKRLGLPELPPRQRGRPSHRSRQ